MLISAFATENDISPNAALMRKNIVRLVDKAVFEYSHARQAILDQMAESKRPYEELVKGRIIYMFGFTDHMENCVNATRRVLGLLENLRSDSSAPAQDRIIRRLVDAHSDPLVNIRNTLEHMGDAINKGEIGEKQPVFLGLSDDQESVSIGGHNLSFGSLAIILKGLHAECIRLLESPNRAGGGA